MTLIMNILKLRNVLTPYSKTVTSCVRKAYSMHKPHTNKVLDLAQLPVVNRNVCRR